MPPQNNPDRIRILFATIAWWPMPPLLPATLARQGLRELVDHHLDLGGAPGRANTGDKMLPLVGGRRRLHRLRRRRRSRAGGTVGVPVGAIQGTFLQLPVGACPSTRPREPPVVGRAWAAGAGPGDSPLTIDLDSTIYELDWPRRERATTAIPAPAAITRCWPLPPAPARC